MGTDEKHYPVDREWRHGFVSTLPPTISAVAGTLAESTEIIADGTAKRALRAATGAVAVDMESAAIARVAGGSRLPFLTVRAIADSAAMKLPHAVLQALTPWGNARLSVLLLDLLIHPRQLGELIRLGQAFAAAMACLRRTRSHVGDNFSLPIKLAGN